jgi:hypothetical protein
MRLEVLHVPDCPNLPPLLARLAEVTNLPVTTRVIESEADAARFGMAGSPTLLVDGVDPFATGGGCGLSCRLYRDEDGRIVATPSVDQLRGALGPAEVFSAWRSTPMAGDERELHRAIVRSFAHTGRPPRELDRLTGGGTADVLRALHDLDAIRLSSYGEIVVAYPFSAVPTRHRVRIDGRVDTYARCAIDALGISPMLGRDTVIASVDVTNHQAIKVITQGGRRTWEPTGTVVFVGADTTGGPSADCCCDYLNFFTDRESGESWMQTHPHVPGRLLDQPEADALAVRLFGDLLAPGNNSPDKE